jgi:hypothetical protein
LTPWHKSLLLKLYTANQYIVYGYVANSLLKRFVPISLKIISFSYQCGSAAVLAVGIWTVVDKSFIEILLRNTLFMSAAYIMIFTGCCAIVLSFIGAYGALKASPA